MTKVMFNFQYHKGIIKLELKFFGMNLFSTFCTRYSRPLIHNANRKGDNFSHCLTPTLHVKKWLICH